MSDAASRPWLASYAPGVPHELAAPSGSLFDLIEASAKNYPDRPALEFFGRVTTYAELFEQIERAAEGLRRLGVQQGDPVGIVLPNCPQHIVAFYAVLRLGAIVVEHNPLYTPRELRHQFEDHGARVVIAWDKVVATIQDFPADVAVASIVSVDVIGNPHSAVFDALSTMAIGDRFFKVLAWYDNEFGYSGRMVDMLRLIGR